MGDNKEEMESLGPIPEGWVADTIVKKNGTKIEDENHLFSFCVPLYDPNIIIHQCFLCPETEQRFYTYKDLMRYVTYAKKAKLSIYDPNFKSNMKEKDSVPFKREGQNSNPSVNIKIRKDIKVKTDVKDRQLHK